jgi:uncharacterized protein YhaN
VRIRSVTAHAFGAISDKTLNLGDGLNIVLGRNGTGKSTWHAALYGALCGFQFDQRYPIDQRFRRRRPRLLPGWRVSAELVLDDGREVLIAQDLTDPADSTVIDQHSGADLSREIRRDGILDASAWLGMNRRSFGAMAYLEQAFGLLHPGAESSERPLQRAVATEGGTHTVSDAISRIERHRARVIGDRHDPHSPISIAVSRFAEATRAAESAQSLRHQLELAERTHYAHRHQANQARDLLHNASHAVARDAVNRYSAELLQAQDERAHYLANLEPGEPRFEPVHHVPPIDFATRLRVEQAETRFLQARADLQLELSETAAVAESVTETIVQTATRTPSPGSGIAALGALGSPSVRLWAGLAGGTVLVGLIMLIIGVAQGSVPVDFVGGVVTLAGLFAAALAVFPSLRGVVVAPPLTRTTTETAVVTREVVAASEIRERSREQQRHRLDTARAGLRAALAAAGISAAVDDHDLVMALESYRQERDRPPAPPPPPQPDPGVEHLARLDARIATALRQLEDAEHDLADHLLPGHQADPLSAFSTPASDVFAMATSVTLPGYAMPSYGYPAPIPVPPPVPTAAEVDKLREAHDRAVSQEEAALGRVEDLRHALAESEPIAAGLEVAQTEFDHFDELATVFATAISRLESARTAVHQQVAQELEFQVGDWLRDVTAQRYTDVRIDPDTLEVYISGPDDPEVNALEDSQGTADQVQLLLRLALFVRSRGNHGGPLLLDDVLAHGDPARSIEMLKILGRIADRGHQVVVFTTQRVDGFPATVRLAGTAVEPDPELVDSVTVDDN